MLRGRTVIVALVSAAAVVLTQAGESLAATIDVTRHNLTFNATGSAVNDLIVGRHPGLIEVRDTASTLTAGAGCKTISTHEATCATRGIDAFTARLGPGDDQAVIRNPLRLASIVVNGGQGADTLVSAAAAVQLFGGPGNDHLKGGPLGDALHGNSGNDLIRGGAGADLLRGGRDDDQLRGGPGWDHEYGGPGDDLVYGERGNDLLYGGPGEDRLADFFGLDRLYGGPDADYLNTFELDNPLGEPGDYENASRGPDYGCRASPGDTLVGCDENAKNGHGSAQPG